MSTNKPWGGRFDDATDPTVERFSTSIHFDRVLARHDLRGSRAQARMLGKSGLISNEDSEELLRGLDLVATEIEDGSFPFDPALEDIHMNIEMRLRHHLGPVAGKLHTGRSRNDQIATDLALFLREKALRALHIDGTRIIIGIVDDDRNLRGRLVNGYRVLGNRQEMIRIIRDHAVDRVIVTMELSEERYAAIQNICLEAEVPLSVWAYDEVEGELFAETFRSRVPITQVAPGPPRAG